MKRLTKPEVRALAKFKPGDAVTYQQENGVIGCPFSKEGRVWYSVIFPRYGKSGRYYDAVERAEESKLQRRVQE